MKRLLKVGDRIRCKVRLMSGWRGFGTVIVNQMHAKDPIIFIKEGTDERNYENKCCAARSEVSLCR